MMYDVLVIGGGPAGVTAAIYAVRGGMKTALFEKMYIGGQIASTNEMVNYPGFRDPISGVDFAEELHEQATRLGVEIIYETVNEMELNSDVKVIKTKGGSYEGRTVVIASGANYRKLGLPSEERFTGRGVSYCATCDGNFYQDKVVGVVGGGNNATGEAIYLSKICKTVYIFCRTADFTANSQLKSMVLAADNIRPIYNVQVGEILGEEAISGVLLRDVQSEQLQEIEVDGLFVAIGRAPDVGFLDPRCLDGKGHIITDEDMDTKFHPGVFAAGDVRAKKLRQVATAVGDGAIAGNSAIEYVKELEHQKK